MDINETGLRFFFSLFPSIRKQTHGDGKQIKNRSDTQDPPRDAKKSCHKNSNHHKNRANEVVRDGNIFYQECWNTANHKKTAKQ